MIKAFLLAALFALAAPGQTPEYSVGYLLPPENNFTSLPSGGRLSYPPVGLNRGMVATVVIANRGAVRGTVNSIAVAGEAFLLTGAPALPAALDPGRELRIGIVFTPRQAGRSAGALALGFGDSLAFRAELTGTTAAAELSLSYVLPSEGNLIPVPSGGTLPFPATRVNATASAVVLLGNRGFGGGTVTEIALSGDRFRLTGVGALPLFLDAGTELRIGVVFEARDMEAASGLVRFTVDGQALTLRLEGRGLGAKLVYEIVEGAPAAAVPANGKLTFPETALGETSTITIQVLNAGNADGGVAGIAAVGDGFQLSNLPFFPQTLTPGSVLWFQIAFAPKLPGRAAGRLRIGTDTLDLEALARGAQLVYFYRGESGAVALRDNRSVLWAPVELGQTSALDIVIRNTGNAAAPVGLALVVDSRSAFKLGTGSRPAAIEPEAELVLAVTFTPVVTGDHTARLYIGEEILNLVGVGAPLPALPPAGLRGPEPLQAPLQQRPVSLSIAAPYPLPLTGVLTLSVNSGSFNVDPAVQFSTGGRSAAFTIPAGATRAMFQGRPEVFFQTGSVAASITIQSSFAARGVNVTPEPAPSIEVTVAPAAPQVLDVQLEARSANTLAVVVTGLATTRALDRVELQFAASPKYNVPAGRFSFDLTSYSAAWYRRRDSETYGSLFTVSIPFTIQSGGKLNLEEVFESVSATLVNQMGRSNTLGTQPLP